MLEGTVEGAPSLNGGIFVIIQHFLSMLKLYVRLCVGNTILYNLLYSYIEHELSPICQCTTLYLTKE